MSFWVLKSRQKQRKVSMSPHKMLPPTLHTRRYQVPLSRKAAQSSFPRLDCPVPSGDRYNYLKAKSTEIPNSGVQPTYFFALDLHQSIKILARLFGSIMESIRFLGPENCALSVVEGRSSDGTFEVLTLLSDEMERIGTKYSLSYL